MQAAWTIIQCKSTIAGPFFLKLIDNVTDRRAHTYYHTKQGSMLMHSENYSTFPQHIPNLTK